MNSYESRALRLMAKMLEESVEAKAGALVDGSAQSFDQYRYAVGYIKALHDVTEFLSVIDDDLRKGQQ